MRNKYIAHSFFVPLFMAALALMVLLLILTGRPVSAGGGTTYSSGTIDLDILDDGCNYVESIINVPDTGTVADINVNLSILHTYDDDLDILLLGPDGTTEIELATDIGSFGDNFTDTTFDDEAATAISSVDNSSEAPFTGSYQPEGSLSDFDSLSYSGDWTLRVCDDYNDSGDTSGTLQNWSITIETAVPPPVFNIDTTEIDNPILVAEGGTATKPITISNTGGSLLTWTLAEAAPLAKGRATDVFFDDFESGLGSWDVFTGTTAVSTRVFITTTTRSNSPDNSAYVLYDSSNNVDTWLVSPAIAVSANGGEFSFYESINYIDDIDTHEVVVSTDYAGDVTTATWTSVPLAAAFEDTWQMQGPFDFAAYAGQTVYIAFHYIGTNADSWYLDNVLVTEPEACDLANDVSWLALSATAGTTAAGAASAIDVTIDAAAYVDGDVETATLCIDHDGVELARLELELDIMMDVQGPNAIDLASFTATVQADGSVAVAWETAAEWDHAGFNIYRSAAADGALAQVNAAIVASEGTQGQGASYALTDRDVPTGDVWYTLEDIDIHGISTLHDPIQAEAFVPTAVGLSDATASAGMSSSLLLTIAMLTISLAIFAKLAYSRQLKNK